MTQQQAAPEPGESGSNPHPALLWVGIVLTYILLFSISGYIAFLQEPYNPASSLSERTVELLSNDATRPALQESLKLEGEAFKARRDLAGQSFNVVLGALLGFLSASATQGLMPRRGTNGS